MIGSWSRGRSETIRKEAGWALRPTRGPELLQLAAKLLAGTGPVGNDVITKILHVTLEIQLVLLEPAHVEFLSGCASSELAGDVLFIVANDSALRYVRLSNHGLGLE